MADLPGAHELPITEGPPTQAEPKGQNLSGPAPQEVPPLRAQVNQVDLGRLLMARPMPVVTPDRVLAEMQKLLGTGESPAGSNCNAITARCGLGCVAWCDEGWWTALFNAGFNDGAGHVQMPGVATDYWFGDAYVPSTLRHFQSAGRVVPTPVLGAGEIHYWGGGEGNSHIAGYVKDYGDGTHLNIECNHNNVSEYVRRRNNDPTIKGYCIPVYSSAPTPSPTPSPAKQKEYDPMIVPAGESLPYPLPQGAKNGLVAFEDNGEGPCKAKIIVGHGPASFRPAFPQGEEVNVGVGTSPFPLNKDDDFVRVHNLDDKGRALTVGVEF